MKLNLEQTVHDTSWVYHATYFCRARVSSVRICMDFRYVFCFVSLGLVSNKFHQLRVNVKAVYIQNIKKSKNLLQEICMFVYFSHDIM